MSRDAAEHWAGARSFHHSRYLAERIASGRTTSVTVCLPARECAETVGGIVTALLGLRTGGVLDEVVVVDAGSHDGTAAVAAEAGARVLQEADLAGEHGPVLGKGDAMWRALMAIESDVVCFLDADTEQFAPHFACGLIGAVLLEPGVSFAKAFYRRPFAGSEGGESEGGGRVNHLLARPALELLFPALAEVRQPLAGEIAARRELLEMIPFVTGYGVEVAMLIDVCAAAGLDAIAQVDLEEHHNPHKPLAELVPMARTVLATIAARAAAQGRIDVAASAPVERPALSTLRVA